MELLKQNVLFVSFNDVHREKQIQREQSSLVFLTHLQPKDLWPSAWGHHHPALCYPQKPTCGGGLGAEDYLECDPPKGL